MSLCIRAYNRRRHSAHINNSLMICASLRRRVYAWSRRGVCCEVLLPPKPVTGKSVMLAISQATGPVCTTLRIRSGKDRDGKRTGRPGSRPPFAGVGLILIGVERGLSVPYAAGVADFDTAPFIVNGLLRRSFLLWVSWAWHSNALFGTAKRL